MVKALVESGGSKDIRGSDGATAMVYAAWYDQPEVVNYLLEIGADPLIGGKDNSSPMYYAAASGNMDILRILLDFGGDPDSNFRDDGSTPMHIAVEREHPDAVSLLLDAGGSENSRDNAGDTLLHCAAVVDDPACTLLLVRRGADVNARNNSGATPLMPGACWGYTKSVQTLLDHGSNPWMVDEDGRTSLDWAAIGEANDDAEGGNDHAGTRAALEHAMNVTWQNNSPPTLEELAAFQLRRMRLQIDKEEFVDTIPDALVKFYFSDWEGAAKWIGDWDRKGVEDPSEWKRQRDEDDWDGEGGEEGKKQRCT